jgi:hypothetical protein
MVTLLAANAVESIDIITPPVKNIRNNITAAINLVPYFDSSAILPFSILS